MKRYEICYRLRTGAKPQLCSCASSDSLNWTTSSSVTRPDSTVPRLPCGSWDKNQPPDALFPSSEGEG